MGNGASVNYRGHRLTHSDFIALEKLCRSQHFRDNFQEYLDTFRRAVENDAIDMLEILIPAGNAMRVKPLHLACKLARMESAEVLLSAGFSCLLQDEQGRTPLHVCCTSRSPNSALCATLVALSGSGKKALTVRDNDGLTPLHLAVVQNNIKVIEALMTNGADANATTPRGQNAYQIASSCENYEALQVLKDLVSEKGRILQEQKAKSRSAKNGSTAEPGRQQSQVEYDRIMQVWERFFENAFKRMGLDPDDLEDDTADWYGASPATSARTVPSSSKHRAKKTKVNKQQGQDWEDEGYGSSARRDVFSREASYEQERRELYARDMRKDSSRWAEPSGSVLNSSVRPKDSESKVSSWNTNDTVEVGAAGSDPEWGEPHSQDHYAKCLEWFQWVVRYQPPPPQDAWDEDGDAPAAGEYYVLNIHTGETAWLDDHIAAFRRDTLWPCDDWTDFELHMTLPLPVNLVEAVSRGWLTYYTEEENVCRWINIPTKCTEEYLPLGYGEDVTWLAESGLQLSCADGVWCAADQLCSTAWVLVVAPADPSADAGFSGHDSGGGDEVCYYYRNRVTGDSRWEPPPGWDNLVLESWHGWTLCCEEDAPDDLYW